MRLNRRTEFTLMALERKDVRFKMDADPHSALASVATLDGMDIGEWCEEQIMKAVAKRVHDANVLSAETRSLVIPGIFREPPGKPGEGAA